MFLKIVQDFLVFLQPQLLRWLLIYISWYQTACSSLVEGEKMPAKSEGFFIATIMFVAAVAQRVVYHQVSFVL